MTLIRGRTKAGTNKQVKKGAVASSDMKNGEEVLQYHNGRLKIIRKEFGKLFELEFSSPEQKELKTFAKHSDLKVPQNNAVKIFKDGVRIAGGGLTSATAKSFYGKVPEAGDGNIKGGEFEIAPDGESVFVK